MSVLNELKSRIEWLGEAARLVEAGELQPTVAEYTLKRYLRTPARSVITYCDVDADAGYSDTGVHEAEVKSAKAKYLAAIAALEATITKRKESEKEAERNRPLLEAMNNLENTVRSYIDRSEPQQEEKRIKEKRKLGRPIKDIRERINTEKYTDIEAMYSKLESLIRGRGGKALALIILVAINKGVFIGTPTFGELQKAFGATGSDKGYLKYMGKEGLKGFTPEERSGVIRSLLAD